MKSYVALVNYTASLYIFTKMTCKIHWISIQADVLLGGIFTLFLFLSNLAECFKQKLCTTKVSTLPVTDLLDVLHFVEDTRSAKRSIKKHSKILHKRKKKFQHCTEEIISSLSV